MAAGQQPLGSLLVELGFIDDAQLESALEEQQRSGARLGKILVDAGIITEERLVHALSRQLGIETCDPLMTSVHERVLKLVPIELAYLHRCLPVALKKEDTGEVVFVATSDPLNKTALSDLRNATNNRRVRWLIAGETAIEMALARHYGAPPKRNLQPTPLPAGTPVITGKPVSAPKNAPPLSAPPRASDLLMLSSDLDSSSPIAGSLAIEGFGFPSEDLPPIEVPPELLASPEAALQIIEAEMPRPSNGSSDLPDLSDSIEAAPELLFEAAEGLEMAEAEPVEADAPVVGPESTSENGHRPLPPMPAPSQPFGTSWGDLVGSDLMAASVFSWQPDPLPSSELPAPPADTLEVEDDRIEVEESIPIEEAIPIEDPMTIEDPIPIEEAVPVEEAVPEEDPVPIEDSAPLEVFEQAEQPGQDPTETGGPPLLSPEPEDTDQTADQPRVEEELPDASLDAIPASDAANAPFEEATEMEVTRAAVMRQVLLRFIEDGVLEVGSQAVLRVLAAVMEREGLLTEEKIAAAIHEDDE